MTHKYEEYCNCNNKPHDTNCDSVLACNCKRGESKMVNWCCVHEDGNDPEPCGFVKKQVAQKIANTIQSHLMEIKKDKEDWLEIARLLYKRGTLLNDTPHRLTVTELSTKIKALEELAKNLGIEKMVKEKLL